MHRPLPKINDDDTVRYIKVVSGTGTVGVEWPIPEITWAKLKIPAMSAPKDSWSHSQVPQMAAGIAEAKAAIGAKKATDEAELAIN